MKAAVIHDFKGIDGVEIVDLPTPEPKKDEVLIRIKAAGVNPVDWKVTEGLLKRLMEYELPITLGWDCAGIIEDPGNSAFKAGDEVYALCKKSKMHEGTFAEYICMPASLVVHKPKNLSFEEAACVPLSALIAWQALSGNIKQGQRVLIHAGAGGVGSFAIPMAKHLGAYVLTTASASNRAYCELLGADEILDYTKRERPDEPVDFALDSVGPKVLTDCFHVTKKGGLIVTIASPVNQELVEQHGIRCEFVFVEPNRSHLQEITKLIEQGAIKAPAIAESYTLERVQEALTLQRSHHVQGKLAILPIASFPK